MQRGISVIGILASLALGVSVGHYYTATSAASVPKDDSVLNTNIVDDLMLEGRLVGTPGTRSFIVESPSQFEEGASQQYEIRFDQNSRIALSPTEGIPVTSQSLATVMDKRLRLFLTPSPEGHFIVRRIAVPLTANN